MIAYIIPDAPKWVQIATARDAYQLKTKYLAMQVWLKPSHRLWSGVRGCFAISSTRLITDHLAPDPEVHMTDAPLLIKDLPLAITHDVTVCHIPKTRCNWDWLIGERHENGTLITSVLKRFIAQEYWWHGTFIAESKWADKENPVKIFQLTILRYLWPSLRLLRQRSILRSISLLLFFFSINLQCCYS